MKKSETGEKKWSSFMKLDQFQKKSENNFYFFFRTCNPLNLKSGMNFLVIIFQVWSKIEKNAQFMINFPSRVSQFQWNYDISKVIFRQVSKLP